jgi:hypothetical protein
LLNARLGNALVEAHGSGKWKKRESEKILQAPGFLLVDIHGWERIKLGGMECY